jgi:hypothetical protein
MVFIGWEVNPNFILSRPRVSESQILGYVASAYIGVMMRAYSANLFKARL